MSKTSVTKTRRANKLKKAGRARKNKLEQIGTTRSWKELFEEEHPNASK